MLFRAGDPVLAVHKIVSGLVAIAKPVSNGRRQIVDFLMAGDMCGFLQYGGRYVFDCEAMIDTSTCTIGSIDLQNFVSRHRDVAIALEDAMVQRQERLAEHMAAIGQLTSRERVVYFLTWLNRAYAERGLPSHPLPLPMTRTDIADFVGLRIETVSRALKELKDRHFLDEVAAEYVVVGRSPVNIVASDGYLN
jgi:CRP/FNR family transcriptional regulator